MTVWNRAFVSDDVTLVGAKLCLGETLGILEGAIEGFELNVHGRVSVVGALVSAVVIIFGGSEVSSNDDTCITNRLPDGVALGLIEGWSLGFTEESKMGSFPFHSK